MAIRELSGDAVGDELLDWLDGHTTSVSTGLALPLMYQKWIQAKRDPLHLADSLQALVDADWIEVTPASEPPHLRFSRIGYSRLLDAAAVADPVLTPPPVPDATPVAPMPAQPASRAPVPAFVSEDEAPVWLVPDGSPTEVGLRNQLLDVFRHLALRSGDPINATRLSRYWQEMGQRAGNLRLGLDVVMRDRYLRPQRMGLDMIFILTAEGFDFIRGPLTPAALLSLSPPIGFIQPQVVSEADLRGLVATAVARSQAPGNSVTHADLLFAWAATGLDENDLVHGLDLLFKAGYLQFDAGVTLVMSLTAGGQRFAQDARLRGDAGKRAAQLA